MWLAGLGSHPPCPARYMFRAPGGDRSTVPAVVGVIRRQSSDVVMTTSAELRKKDAVRGLVWWQISLLMTSSGVLQLFSVYNTVVAVGSAHAPGQQAFAATPNS